MLVGGTRLHRDGLGERLGQQDGIDMIGTAADPKEAVARMRTIRPEIVLLDMASGDGHRAIRIITGADATVAVLALELDGRDDEVLASV